MVHDLPATEGSYPARLLGCYDASLAPVIAEIVAPALVIDVGSAEGYDALGLARLLPATTVRARDSDPKTMAACRDLARRNAVADRVEVGGHLTHAELAVCANWTTSIVCDIEGAEADLLDPARAPARARAHILVEVHEGMAPGLTRRIEARFLPSHHVTRLGRSLAPGALPPLTEGWSDLDRLPALWEWRAEPTPWLWMQPRGPAPGP